MLRLSPVAHTKQVQGGFKDESDLVLSSGNTPQLVPFFREDADQGLGDAHQVCQIIFGRFLILSRMGQLKFCDLG